MTLEAFTESGVDPGATYNATQWIYNMSSDKVIAEIGVLRADFNEALAQISARIDTLEAATSARLDAVDAQIAMLTWAVIATFTVVTAIAATGMFHMWAWGTHGNSGADTATSQCTEK